MICPRLKFEAPGVRVGKKDTTIFDTLAARRPASRPESAISLQSFPTREPSEASVASREARPAAASILAFRTSSSSFTEDSSLFSQPNAGAGCTKDPQTGQGWPGLSVAARIPASSSAVSVSKRESLASVS